MFFATRNVVFLVSYTFFLNDAWRDVCVAPPFFSETKEENIYMEKPPVEKEGKKTPKVYASWICVECFFLCDFVRALSLFFCLFWSPPKGSNELECVCVWFGKQ